MSRTYAEELRDMAAQRKPFDMHLYRMAQAFDRLALVDAAAFEAYDCMGGEEEMRDILARVCDPSSEKKSNNEETSE